jgi:two-component system response regulator
MSNDLINILMVEDSKAHVKLTQEALKRAKLIANFYYAKDGEEALNFIYKKGNYSNAPTPNLILLDLKLPKYSGKEILKILKEDEDLKSIPVIILTTSSAILDIDESYKSHANSYIIKPISFEGLIQTLMGLNNFWFVLSTKPPVND